MFTIGKPKHQKKPPKDSLIEKLLETGLFSKIGTSLSPKYLKLNNTNICVVPIVFKGQRMLSWLEVPPGVSLETLNFFKKRTEDNNPNQAVFELSFSAMLKRLPEDIAKQVSSHLDYLQGLSLRK